MFSHSFSILTYLMSEKYSTLISKQAISLPSSVIKKMFDVNAGFQGSLEETFFSREITKTTMEHHVHCYLKSSKIRQHAGKVIQLLKAWNSEADARGIEGENNYFNMFLCTMVVAMLGNSFLGTALTHDFRQSHAYNPVYLNVHIICLSKKNKKVF